MAIHPPGPRRLNPSQQSAMLLAVHPQFRVVSRGRQYVWSGTLQPTPLATVYTVRIDFALGESPHVVVTDPPLTKRGDEPIPHLYADGHLCLYLPGGWTSREYIATTIVPWTATWLHYYETWHATGEWLGGGEHPVAAPDGEEHSYEETLSTNT